MCDGKCIDCLLPVHCEDPAWREGENLKIREDVKKNVKSASKNKGMAKTM
jgi:hypothetical protein